MQQMQHMLADLTAALHGLQPAAQAGTSSSSQQLTADDGSAGADISLQAVLQQHGLGAAQLQGMGGLLQVRVHNELVWPVSNASC